MELTPAQQKELKDALLAAFPDPSWSNLEQAVYFATGKYMEVIVNVGKPYGDRVFDLVRYVVAQDLVADIVEAARRENPRNRRLHEFATSIGVAPALGEERHAPIGAAPALGEERQTPIGGLSMLHRFDMRFLIAQCLEVLPEHGLAGVAVACDHEIFVTSLVERLREELRLGGRRNTRIMRPPPLKPKISSIDDVLRPIREYKKLLSTGDVLCPIHLQIYDTQAEPTISDTFWQHLSNEFADDSGVYKHRLIIIMTGDSDTVFPAGASLLHKPKFNRDEVFKWVSEVINTLRWPEHATHKWIEALESICASSGLDRIQCVYDNLSSALQDLQESTSYEEFLGNLNERRNSYAETPA